MWVWRIFYHFYWPWGWYCGVCTRQEVGSASEYLKKCWRFLIKKGTSFVNEISGIPSGLVTHSLGDLDFWKGVGTWVSARHWAVLCPFVVRKPCLSIQWKYCAIYLGTPGTNEVCSCAALQLRHRTEEVAEGQHWRLVHSAVWTMVPRETCPNGTFWNNSKSWGWDMGSLYCFLSAVPRRARLSTELGNMHYGWACCGDTVWTILHLTS